MPCKNNNEWPVWLIIFCIFGAIAILATSGCNCTETNDLLSKVCTYEKEAKNDL